MINAEKITQDAFDKAYRSYATDPDWEDVAKSVSAEEVAALLFAIRAGDFVAARMLTEGHLDNAAVAHAKPIAARAVEDCLAEMADQYRDRQRETA